MKRLFLLALLLVPFLAQGQIQWRISIKVFTNTDGTLPQIPGWGYGGATLLQELSNGVNRANTLLTNTGRGYSWKLTEIEFLSGTTAALPASAPSWFNLAVDATTQDDLDAKAKANPAGFKFRNNAVNFYYVNGTASPFGGYCAGPSENEHVILIAPDSSPLVLLHESGHFFNLPHPHDNEIFRKSDNSACADNPPCTCAIQLPGDDGFADTPKDNQCWTQDMIARSHFAGRAYATLNATEQFTVDNTWSNIMSYHPSRVRFTDDQMDAMTDASNITRIDVASGRTRLVDRTRAGPGDGSVGNPFRTVAAGVNAATNGEIVLIRTGYYNESGTYTNPITLRATRGPVTITTP